MDRMAHVDVDQSTVKPHSFQTLSKVFFSPRKTRVSEHLQTNPCEAQKQLIENSDPECLLLFHPGGQSCLVEKNHYSPWVFAHNDLGDFSAFQ